MDLSNLKPAEGSKKRPKRVGRGPGSGHGKTSCRGHKGQKARSGGKVSPGFEGGQMPIQRRLPKRGFRNVFKKEFAIIHVGDLKVFDEGFLIDEKALREKGLVKGRFDGIKLLSDGDIDRPVTIRVDGYSKRAREKIEAAGGKIVEV
jgi:large subunit ribosomal protein L15